jgi:hypothetical protein
MATAAMHATPTATAAIVQVVARGREGGTVLLAAGMVLTVGG